VDLALWDLRGKAANQPVWRLLKAKRTRLNAYASMLGYSTKPEEARRVARDFFDRGFSRQKWFFFNGPVDGAEGLKQNIALAEALREELGPNAQLMFDGIQYVWKSADVAYAIALAKGLLPIEPHWLEEPLRPDDLEGYIRLKGETGITLAAGEHWYTRWNVRPFLERKTVSFVQSDPEWCGGITEWLNICALVKGYPGVQVIPHGHHVLAASNCVASQSETLCPMLEFLFQSRAEFQHCQTRPLMAEGGYFAMAEEPGLGPTLDFARRLAAHRRPVWVRFVLVPGLTDDADTLSGIAGFAASLGNVERVEVLPFHQLGRYKWEQLALNYTLTDTEPPTQEALDKACAVFHGVGLRAF